MAITNTLCNTILSANFTTQTHYLALHVQDPTNAGLASTELSTALAPTYTRQPVSWSTPSNRSVSNTAIINWVGLPIVSCGYLGAWSARTGGTLLAVFNCANPLTVLTSGGSIYLPVSAIAVTLAGSPDGRVLAVPSDPFKTYVEDPLNPGVFQS